MDKPYLLAAARYVELNPVQARLVEDAADCRSSSARAHLAGRDDRLVKVAPLSAMIGDWRAFLASAMPEEELAKLRGHSRTGRPLGDKKSVERLGQIVGRIITPQKRGPKPKHQAN